MSGGCSDISCEETSSEFLDLCHDDDSGEPCTPPPSMPGRGYSGVSLKTPDGNPLFCGGHYHNGRCYEYVHEIGAWRDGLDLLSAREDSAFTARSDGGFWVLSGLVDNDPYTSEVYEVGSFSLGDVLPQDGYERDCGPCAVRVSDDVTFFANTKGPRPTSTAGGRSRRPRLLCPIQPAGLFAGLPL